MVLLAALALAAACGAGPDPVSTADASDPRVAVIVVTDLYHPHQDVGDNLDVIKPFALSDVDLRAVILDVTDEYLQPVAFPNEPAFTDANGPRAPGTIALEQLNRIFRRSVPFAEATHARMRAKDDAMLDAPAEEQRGITLLLDTLRQSAGPIAIVSTGSVRALAVAWLREPALMKAKISRIHVVAGSSSPSFYEWNVHLDPIAMEVLLESELPIALYPCATADGPFADGVDNTHVTLPDLAWFADVAPPLRAFAFFALTRSPRTDYLAAMDETPDASAAALAFGRRLDVWEVPAWLAVTGRKLVRHRAGDYAIVRAAEVVATDAVLADSLTPAKVRVKSEGGFEIEPKTDDSDHVLVYRRANPVAQGDALREAIPRWYEGFVVPGK